MSLGSVSIPSHIFMNVVKINFLAFSPAKMTRFLVLKIKRRQKTKKQKTFSKSKVC